MSKVQRPDPQVEGQESKVAFEDGTTANETDLEHRTVDVGPFLEPTAEEISVLNWFERFAFRLVRRMNQGGWKRFWTFCQRTLGAGWIHLSTYNLMQVYGLEHVAAAARERPILIVANHRSFFDMYTVSTAL